MKLKLKLKKTLLRDEIEVEVVVEEKTLERDVIEVEVEVEEKRYIDYIIIHYHHQLTCLIHLERQTGHGHVLLLLLLLLLPHGHVPVRRKRRVYQSSSCT